MKRLTLDIRGALAVTPRTLRPLGEDGPFELIPAFHAHIKSPLRKPSWGRREEEENGLVFRDEMRG